MGAILGLNGIFNGNILVSAIESLKHRGEDSSGIFLLSNEKIIFNNNMSSNKEDEVKNNMSSNKEDEVKNNMSSNKEDKINDIYNFDYFNNNFNIGLAHNYISIGNKIDNNKISCINHDYNSNEEISYKLSKLSDSLKNQQHDIINRQPVKYKNLILVVSGEIYNLDEIKDFLKYHDMYHNGEILIRIINHFLLKNNTTFLEAIKKTMNVIDGDYAFAIFNGENLAICRDSIGVKPLYYGKRENSYFDENSFKEFTSEKIDENSFKGFASEKIDENSFKGFTSEKIDENSFKGFTSEKIDENSFKGFASEKKALWKMGIDDKNIKTLKPGYILYDWKEIAPNSVPWKLTQEYKSKIAAMNYNKIKKCLKDLIINSTYKRVANLDEVGLVLSGGVDSTILAVLLKNLSNKTDLKLSLYSVGNENSQDLYFSEKIANELEIPLKTQIINEKVVKNSLKPTLNAIEEFNVMKIGVGMVLYLATKLAKKDGINVVLSGQSADELFAGYNRYLSTYENGGYLNVDQELSHDIENSYHINLQRDDAVAMANGVELRVPFLDEKLVKFSLAIPSKYKIYSSTDKLRKHILRDVAIDLGVPEYVAMRKKKAAQYGSGIDKILRKKVLKDFDNEKFMGDLINSWKNKV